MFAASAGELVKGRARKLTQAWGPNMIRNENQSPNPAMEVEVGSTINPRPDKPAPKGGQSGRRRAASKATVVKQKAKQKFESRRCGEGYRRKNGRWEGRYRPTSRVELCHDDVDFQKAFRGIKTTSGAPTYRYEWVSYFNSPEEKDIWLQNMKTRFKDAIKRADQKLKEDDAVGKRKSKTKEVIPSVNETTTAANVYAQMCQIRRLGQPAWPGAWGGETPSEQPVYTDEQLPQVVWYCGGCNQEVDDSTDDATEHDPEIEFDCQTDINFDHDDGVDFDHGHDRDHDYHNHDYHEVETDLDDMMVTDHDRYMLASAAEAAAAACELQTLPVTCV